MPDQKPKQDDKFRHLVALLKSHFEENPQHEKTMREIYHSLNGDKSIA